MKTKHMVRGTNTYRIKWFFLKKNKGMIKAKAGGSYILGKTGI